MIATNDIIHRLKEKDEKAFEEVFRTYYPELCRFAYKYVENQDVAEELVQELFYSLWAKLDAIDINTSIKSYLYSSVRNAAYNYFKRQKVADKYVAHQMNHGAVVVAADQRLEVKELSNRIDKAIESLPDKCKQVFRLSRVENKKYKEIAEELDISIKTVENQMGKALKVLRKELGSYLPVALIIWIEIIIKQ
ncbi:MAG: RNA polymerase sigma-70 factor [Bacteroidia bacterium]|nr:RNA polymerase sigma-70 factor [Bacteroidia bacterium]